MSSAPFTVLIPARLSSSRLPGKPLADIAGLPMVVRVAQRASRSGAARCVVAADDESILAACTAHGVAAVLTRNDHASGSDRLAEACALLGLDGDDIVVNVQGDEPLIAPELIDAVAALLPRQPSASMGTAAHAIDSLADFVNPNVVKVVCDAQGMAHYFSRAPIPSRASMRTRHGGRRHRQRWATPASHRCATSASTAIAPASCAASPAFPGTHRGTGGPGAVACAGTATASPSMSHPMHPALAWTRARIWSGCAPSCPIRRPESAGR